MAALNIPRLPNEDEAEYQRRYTREKMRIYRARKPKGPRKTRGKAKAPKADSLMTNEEWEASRQRADETDEEWRKRYSRERVFRYRGRHRDRLLAERREFYTENRESELARHAVYREANVDKIKTTQAEYYAANKDKRQAALEAWRIANPERYAEVRKRWYDENQALRNFYSSKWRKCCRRQTPSWADFDKIREFYELSVRISAETGILHHVDHIIPLQGKEVSGLHVHTNLRVIPATDNVKKRNKLDEALAHAP